MLDTLPIDGTLLAFLLGAGAWGFFAWLKHWLESLRAHASANTTKLDEADEGAHEQTVKLTEVIATILTEMQEHRRRIDRIEAHAEDAGVAAMETARTVTLNGEQARVAISDVAALKSEVRALSDSFLRFTFLLEAHDKRTSENAVKLDRLYDLFTRGVAAVRT